MSMLIPVILVLISTTVVLLSLSSLKYDKEDRTASFGSSSRRIVCVYSGSSDNYKKNLEEGLKKAAKDFDIGVMFHHFKPLEVEEHCEELDKAIAAKVDGIITNVPDTEAVREYIEIAHKKNIPVILIESDLPDSRRISFIGTNNYAYGVHAGKLMYSATKGLARTALFINPGAAKPDLKQQGYMNTISNYPDMGIELFDVAEASVIEYINTVQSVFVDQPQIDSFLCTDTESTLGVVRAMIEFNKTYNVVIGSGDSTEIMKHIQNGIIYASLVEDTYSIGYLSVECMLKHLMGESISESVNPNILEIRKENVDSFLNDRKDMN